ncbi:hypothetical protein bcgnr5369_11140 [Bacillus cereus]|uniref:Uncharacterized protein n=1 Tax=Bacillus thuringiensis TaxID=1428 RepID=A0A9X6ZR39_BACTU|nr:hypothetical protein [Bacillus thuringiensis]PFJ33216.1 hypothetical protein COJ15_28655 [Bacillus thuringiensis]
MGILTSFINCLFWDTKVNELKKQLQSKSISFQEKEELIIQMYSICKHTDTSYYSDKDFDCAGNMFSYHYCNICGEKGVFPNSY